jgi:hypothetical protein
MSYTGGEGLTISGPNFAMRIADDPDGQALRMVITSSVALAPIATTPAAVGGDLMIGTCKQVM